MTVNYLKEFTNLLKEYTDIPIPFCVGGAYYLGAILYSLPLPDLQDVET
jgi:hypothetical protein